jgi:toxin FitB
VSGFLLDTNVLSELIKPRSEPAVVQWIDRTDEELLYLSVLTIGEIRKRIISHADSIRRARLEAWLSSDLIVRFAGRILPVEIDVAQRWGRIRALAARPLPVIDSLLAATAQQHNLTLVTRNVEDVRGTGVAVFNPWPVR